MAGLTIGAGYVKALVDLAVRKGADLQTLLFQSGVAMEDLHERDKRISLETYQQLMSLANVFGDADDGFLNVNGIRRSGLADLQPGEAISIRVADGRRGRLAVEIATWETGLP